MASKEDWLKAIAKQYYHKDKFNDERIKLVVKCIIDEGIDIELPRLHRIFDQLANTGKLDPTMAGSLPADFVKKLHDAASVVINASFSANQNNSPSSLLGWRTAEVTQQHAVPKPRRETVIVAGSRVVKKFAR